MKKQTAHRHGRRRSHLSLGMALIAVACSPGDRPAASAILVRDSVGIAIAENDLNRLSSSCAVGATPSVSIGTADGAEEYELHRVFGATRLSDGRIALVNQGTQQVRFYDREGKFLLRAGRDGDGPGEFRDAFYLWTLPGDTIWVGDYRPWQFEVFGPDGQWVRGVRPEPLYPNPPGVISVLDDGRSILADRPSSAPSPSGFALGYITVVVHDPGGALIDTIGTYPDGRWGRLGDVPNTPMMYPLFESFARVTGLGSRVLVSHTSEPTLSIYSAVPAVRLERIVRWTPGDRTIGPKDVDEERKRYADTYKNLDPASYKMLVEPMVSVDRPVADRFPAFQSARFGRDGRIWVREYRKPAAPDTPPWIVFDADGRFACRAVFPALSEFLEFGSDYLLALDRDSLGVERVVQYSIAAPVQKD